MRVNTSETHLKVFLKQFECAIAFSLVITILATGGHWRFSGLVSPQ